MRQRPRVVVVDGSRDGEVQVRRSRASRPRGRAVDAHGAAALVILSFAYRFDISIAIMPSTPSYYTADAVGDADTCELAEASAADARSMFSAISNHSAAADGDGTAGACSVVITAAAADARAVLSAAGSDIAAADGDVAADATFAAADTCCVLASRRRHAAAALDGERRAAAARLYGGIVLGRGRDGIRAVEDDGGVAAALDAGAGGDAEGRPTEREGLAAADGDGATDGDAAG